jgi:hypothetical protein
MREESVGMETFKIPLIQEARITPPVITSQEQIPGQPTIQTEPVKQLVIPTQPRIEVQLHVLARLKAIQNRVTKYLQQTQGVRVAVIVQIHVRRAVHRLQEVILQEALLLREALLQGAIHLRGAVVQVVVSTKAIQEEAVQVAAAQEEAEAVEEVHLQVAGGNYF